MLEKLSCHEEKLPTRKVIFKPRQIIAPVLDLSFLQWKSSSGLPQGLKNVGNTCFLNSTLQCLLHTPPVHNYSHTCPKHFCILCALKKLFTTRSQVPQELLVTIPKLSRQFQIGRQADAHELLRFLVDKIDSKDFKTTVFAGELQSTVKCKDCRFESVVNEMFLDLSLEVSSDTVEKCLSDFCREELLTGQNRYSCPGCKNKTNAIKKFLIKTPPNVLTVQLKRFMHNGKKDCRTVGFGEKLCLDKELLMGSGAVYTLYAVLIHVGFGCRSGHYYSFVKAANDVWYEVNDSCVTQASVAKVLNHSGAYILMYKRDVVKSKFENCCVENRNKCEEKFEGRRKSLAHPTRPESPVKKFKASFQDFAFWPVNADREVDKARLRPKRQKE